VNLDDLMTSVEMRTERLHTETFDTRERDEDWRLIGSRLWDQGTDFSLDEEPPLSKWEE